jgi:hypothetical protein
MGHEPHERNHCEDDEAAHRSAQRIRAPAVRVRPLLVNNPAREATDEPCREVGKPLPDELSVGIPLRSSSVPRERSPYNFPDFAAGTRSRQSTRASAELTLSFSSLSIPIGAAMS